MVIYPVPVEVTQARIQLVVDQNAKAPPNSIPPPKAVLSEGREGCRS